MLRLIFLKISNSSLSNNLIKKNCVEIKNINGNVSYTIDGELSNVKINGRKGLASVSLKKDTSSKIFKIIVKEKNKKNMNKNILK